jgi:PPP family 3-phenylpropionic acid transporter
MVVLQVAHGLTFGVFWAAAMAWIGDCVPSKLRATGQVLFGTVTGLGGLIGLLIAGVLYDTSGGANLAFNLAAVLDLVPLALVLLFLRRYELPFCTREGTCSKPSPMPNSCKSNSGETSRSPSR